MPDPSVAPQIVLGSFTVGAGVLAYVTAQLKSYLDNKRSDKLRYRADQLDAVASFLGASNELYDYAYDVVDNRLQADEQSEALSKYTNHLPVMMTSRGRIELLMPLGVAHKAADVMGSIMDFKEYGGDDPDPEAIALHLDALRDDYVLKRNLFIKDAKEYLGIDL